MSERDDNSLQSGYIGSVFEGPSGTRGRDRDTEYLERKPEKPLRPSSGVCYKCWLADPTRTLWTNAVDYYCPLCEYSLL